MATKKIKFITIQQVRDLMAEKFPGVHSSVSVYFQSGGYATASVTVHGEDNDVTHQAYVDLDSDQHPQADFDTRLSALLAPLVGRIEAGTWDTKKEVANAS